MQRTIMRVVSGLVVAFLLMAGSASPVQGAEVAVGSSRDEVVQKLGEPDGTVSVGKIEFLQYSRGTVELEDGIVVNSTVISEAEQQQRLEEQAKQAEARKQRAEERRLELIRQGTAEKEKVLADGSVAKRTPSDQVTYWQRFTKKYPGVDVSAELAAAEEKLAAENQRKQELAEAEANKGPPAGLSSRKLRKYKRGRHTTTE